MEKQASCFVRILNWAKFFFFFISVLRKNHKCTWFSMHQRNHVFSSLLVPVHRKAAFLEKECPQYIYIFFFKHKMFFNATMQFFCFLKLYFIRATCTSRFIYFFGLLLHALKVETSLSFPPSFTSLYTVPLVISLPAGSPHRAPRTLPSHPSHCGHRGPLLFFFFFSWHPDLDSLLRFPRVTHKSIFRF